MVNTGSKLWKRPPGNGRITCWIRDLPRPGCTVGRGRAGGVQSHVSSHQMMVIYGSSETARGIVCSSRPHKEDAHTELAAIQRRAIRMIKRPEGVT